MLWLWNRRKLFPLLLLIFIVVGGLMLTTSNHYHKGSHRSGELRPQTPVVSDARTVAVDIRNFDFFPRELTVAAGARVTWTNRDVAPHDATEEAAGWSTGMLRQGDSESVVFDTTGTYRYLCTIHPTMRATLTVTGRGPAVDPEVTDKIAGRDL